MTEQKELLKSIVSAVDSRMGTDIEILDIVKLTTIADCFVICTGNSVPQIRAIADEVLRVAKLSGIEPLHIEGYRASSWILIDFGSIVLHIFHKEMRAFYSIERLWSGAERIDAGELIK